LEKTKRESNSSRERERERNDIKKDISKKDIAASIKPTDSHKQLKENIHGIVG
jgi:hypothetical protein